MADPKSATAWTESVTEAADEPLPTSEDYVENLKAKLEALGVETDVVNSLADDQIRALGVLQGERDKVAEELLKERAALEAKYHARTAEIDKKRDQFVRGELPASTIVSAAVAGEDVAEAAGPEGGEGGTPIDGFWPACFKHHDLLASIVFEEDKKALSYLKHIRTSVSEDGKGFNLEFEFAENPYFEESVLKKSYSVDDMFEPMEEPTLTNVTGTKITWKAGKDLTVQSVKKDSSISTEPAASFFSFFEPPSIEFADEGDMQEAQDRMQQLEMDFRVGVVIYQSLVPKACQWFTGEAAADQSDDEFDEEDEEDEEDEDDDDDDDGDEGEDGEDKLVFDFKPPTDGENPFAKKEGQSENPDCKQQ